VSWDVWFNISGDSKVVADVDLMVVRGKIRLCLPHVIFTFLLFMWIELLSNHQCNYVLYVCMYVATLWIFF
jgi:hypothetical protein